MYASRYNAFSFKLCAFFTTGLNHNAVRMQLETLLLNPGIDPSMVTVMFDEKFTEPAALAEIFKFKGEKLTSSTKYVGELRSNLMFNYTFPTGSVYGFGMKRRRQRTPVSSETARNFKILHIVNKAGLFHILFGLIKF